MQLYIDESGNTQEIIVLALVAIPDASIDAVNQLFTLRPNDPNEIHILLKRQDKNKKPRDEFKYSDFKNAFSSTDLPVYRDFLRKKFEAIASIGLSVYVSAFPNPGNANNGERLKRLEMETTWLLHKWAHRNVLESCSLSLKIFCDQQVYHRDLFFSAINVRRTDKHYVAVSGEDNFIHLSYPPSIRELLFRNRIQIMHRSSKSCPSLQLADFIAGSFRDKVTRGVFDFFDLLQPVCPRDNIRKKTSDYDPPSLVGHLSRLKLGYED